MKEFMTEFYSPGKTQILRNKIATFAQAPAEATAEAYERFNERRTSSQVFKGGCGPEVLSRPHYCIKGDH